MVPSERRFVERRQCEGKGVEQVAREDAHPEFLRERGPGFRVDVHGPEQCKER